MMYNHLGSIRAGVTLVAMALGAILYPQAVPAQQRQSLQSYNVDIHQTSVSGVSSGAYLAGQLHVAHSASMVGAGFVAGGPYYCSQGSQTTALTECWLSGTPSAGGYPAITVEAEKTFGDGEPHIDDPENLRDDKVYIFTGSADTKVGTSVVDALHRQYEQLLPTESIVYRRNEVDAGHSMVTDDYGGACSSEAGEYINKCPGVDLAGNILKHIYGTDLNPPTNSGGELVEFPQSEFVDYPRGVSMDEVGFVYVPTGCANEQPCRVHVVIHGCSQSVNELDKSYVTKTGYNEWGEANNIIMLYPQSSDWLNDYSCWDFMGYTTENFHTQRGEQVQTIMNMVRKLAGQSFTQTDAERFWCFRLFGFKACF